MGNQLVPTRIEWNWAACAIVTTAVLLFTTQVGGFFTYWWCLDANSDHILSSDKNA